MGFRAVLANLIQLLQEFVALAPDSIGIAGLIG
jgi:hypothetical protein